LESDVRSEIVNICSGKTISVAAILAEMNNIAGYEIEVELQKDLLRKNDIARLRGSNKKLQALIGVAPSIPIQETLRRMYEA
jgi:nucleoside-diphosphate-sugar epimerase